MTTLIERLQTEADLCRNEGADDIARLLDEAVAGLKRQNESNAQLLAALQSARCDIEDWACYASEYMRSKHDLAGDLARLDSIIANHQATQPDKE